MTGFASRRITLAVGCGAALGSLLRLLVGIATVSAGFPLFVATGIVNVLGSLAVGFVATASAPGGRLPLGPARRQFLTSGVCGGLTTFSTMSLDAFAMIASSRPVAAAAWLAAVILASLAAAFAGHALAARLNR